MDTCQDCFFWKSVCSDGFHSSLVVECQVRDESQNHEVVLPIAVA